MAGREILLVLAFAALTGQTVSALGKREEPPNKPPAAAPVQAEPAAEPAQGSPPANLPRFLGEMTVSGTIRRVGNEPFSRLVISDTESRDWYIDYEEQEQLAGFEQRDASFRGRAFAQDMLLANGQKTGVRYFLRGIAPVK